MSVDTPGNASLTILDGALYAGSRKPESTIYEAIISNIPGLICCFQLSMDRQIKFVYLNDGCIDLLELPKNTLWEQPYLLLNMLPAADLDCLLAMAEKSADTMSVLNWEGRVWVEGRQEFKWLNLRATPGVAADGQIHWQGFFTNISQSVTEKLALLEAHAKLKKLTMQLDRIKTDERKRISREIHDEIGGNLTVIKIGMDGLWQELDQHQSALKASVSYLLSVMDRTFGAVHRVVSDLNPRILRLGLVEALANEAHEFERRMRVPCSFSCNQPAIDLNPDQELALYSICREALSNISKHAQAECVAITLDCLAAQVILQIKDDGSGMQPADRFKLNSFGIKGMTERVAALDGEFILDSSPAMGTLITVKLPPPD